MGAATGSFMLKRSIEKLMKTEVDYPGFIQSVIHFETMDLPDCPFCGSPDTASVQAGVIGRTIALAGATTRFKLVANREGRPAYYCNRCEEYFGPDPKRV